MMKPCALAVGTRRMQRAGLSSPGSMSKSCYTLCRQTLGLVPHLHWFAKRRCLLVGTLLLSQLVSWLPSWPCPTCTQRIVAAVEGRLVRMMLLFGRNVRLSCYSLSPPTLWTCLMVLPLCAASVGAFWWLWSANLFGPDRIKEVVIAAVAPRCHSEVLDEDAVETVGYCKLSIGNLLKANQLKHDSSRSSLCK